MFSAHTVCYCSRGAALLLAHFPAATAVLAAPASSLGGSGAIVERADPIGAMFSAKPPCSGNVAAAFGRARHCLAVVFRALAPHSAGVGNARVRCAVSKGAMLDADKLPKDLRRVAVWIGAGQLHRVLAAQASCLRRGGGATFSETLASCAVFGAHTPCFHVGGAAIDRARFLRTVSTADRLRMDHVQATIHRTRHLLLAPPS